MDATTMSPRCLAAWVRAMRASAAAGDRLGSRSTPGRVAVAAQSGGMPLQPVPQEKTSARPRPLGSGTPTGCRARAWSSPAPAAGSPAPARQPSVSASPGCPKSST